MAVVEVGSGGGNTYDQKDILKDLLPASYQSNGRLRQKFQLLTE